MIDCNPTELVCPASNLRYVNVISRDYLFEKFDSRRFGKSGREENCTHPAKESCEEPIGRDVPRGLISDNTTNDKRNEITNCRNQIRNPSDLIHNILVAIDIRHHEAF